MNRALSGAFAGPKLLTAAASFSNGCFPDDLAVWRARLPEDHGDGFPIRSLYLSG